MLARVTWHAGRCNVRVPTRFRIEKRPDSDSGEVHTKNWEEFVLCQCIKVTHFDNLLPFTKNVSHLFNEKGWGSLRMKAWEVDLSVPSMRKHSFQNCVYTDMNYCAFKWRIDGGREEGRMDGWMDGWMDEWMDEWMDGWIGGSMDWWIEGWVDILWNTISFNPLSYDSPKYEFSSNAAEKPKCSTAEEIGYLTSTLMPNHAGVRFKTSSSVGMRKSCASQQSTGMGRAFHGGGIDCTANKEHLQKCVATDLFRK